MSIEKQQKRLVGWKQYLGTAGMKGANYSLAIVCLCSGLLFLLLAIFIFVGYLYADPG